MIDTATVQWLFPSGLVAGIFGWGLKEYIAHLRRRDVAHTRSEAEHAKQLDSVVKNLTRITDVLTGFEGHGGLLERVDTIDANADAALIRVTQLEKKVAYLEIVSGYRDTYITRLGRMLNVEFVPPEPRKE